MTLDLNANTNNIQKMKLCTGNNNLHHIIEFPMNLRGFKQRFVNPIIKQLEEEQHRRATAQHTIMWQTTGQFSSERNEIFSSLFLYFF